MGYNAKLEGTIASSATVNKSKSRNTEFGTNRCECRLPIDMEPSRETFEALGFSFTEIIGDNILYLAHLPKGWTLKRDLLSYWTSIIDAKGHIRGAYFYKSVLYERSGYMKLESRFYITHYHAEAKNLDSPIIVSVKDTDGNELFIAGQCKGIRSSEFDVLCNRAKEYLQSNYPDWENYAMYWD